MHEENLSQPLQIDNKQFKIPATFLMGYNGLFLNATEKSKFYFTKTFDEDDLYENTLSPGAYELESSIEEMKRIVIAEGFFIEIV